MEENVLDSKGASPRPTFLTVLCILTFIGSGLGVLGGLLGLVGSSALGMFSTAAAGGSIMWTILGLVAASLCLFGAIQMWKLKKQGFTLYLSGSVISIATSIISAFMITSAASAGSSVVNNMGGEFADEFNAAYAASAGAVNTAVWTGVLMGVAITVLFVLMYNANRKHLVH